jgi:hypothetical protein
MSHAEATRAPLTILFRMDNPEQVESLHALRAAFQGATDIEAVSAEVFALHVWPGCCSCEIPGDEGAAA